MLRENKIILYFTLSLFIASAHAATPQTEIVQDQAVENNTSNMLNTLNNMSSTMSSTNTAVQAQTQVLEESLTGITGVGAMFNTAQEQNFRNWTPSAEDLVNMVAEGLQTGSMADQIKYYNQKFPIPKVTDLTPNDDSSIAGKYGVYSAVNTNAAFSVADKSFDQAQQIVNQINFLYTLIDRQQTLKQSMDLNTAVLAKIATLQNDLLRVQAQQLKMQAVSQQQSNTTRTLMAGFVQEIK
jgi:type IV secretion system protein VirB5